MFMKKFVLFLLLFVTCSLFAQEEVTKFLGIPVDGTKSEMIRKLKEKGFKESKYDTDVLTGEFNGVDVNIYVVTNKSKVYRIMVCDCNLQSETSIVARFNKLYYQFYTNGKYMPTTFDRQNIPIDEDIRYEINVNQKRYEASFFQYAEKTDSVEYNKKMQNFMLSKYSEEELINMSKGIYSTDDIKDDIMEFLYQQNSNRIVWFMISEFEGQYYISMFYDNVCNMANGEDL